MINSQMLGRDKTSKNNLSLNSHKRTVSNTLKRNGKETIKSRHAIPLDIESLIEEQRDYPYIEIKEDIHQEAMIRAVAETAKNNAASRFNNEVEFPQLVTNSTTNNVLDDLRSQTDSLELGRKSYAIQGQDFFGLLGCESKSKSIMA